MRVRIDLAEIKKKCASPFSGANGYGEWGAMNEAQRATMLALVDMVERRDEIIRTILTDKKMAEAYRGLYGRSEK